MDTIVAPVVSSYVSDGCSTFSPYPIRPWEQNRVDFILKDLPRGPQIPPPAGQPQSNAYGVMSVLSDVCVGTNSIINPDDGKHGVNAFASSERELVILKQKQVVRLNYRHDSFPFRLFWDEVSPRDIITILESTGKSPTMYEDRLLQERIHLESGAAGPARRKFDTKSVHFDTIVISLLNSVYFPRTFTAPEDGLKPTPLDDLPVRSLLGRPGWVFLEVGSTPAGLQEGLRLFEVWGVRRAEELNIIFTGAGSISCKEGVLRSSHTAWIMGLEGIARRYITVSVCRMC